MSLNIFSRDSLRKYVEQVSSGKNTVLYDDDGNPSFMAIIPRATIGDVFPSGVGLDSYLSDTHPAFEIYNGTDKVGETPEIFISLYQNTLINGSACSIPDHIPSYISYSNAQSSITRKGNNWHMMNIWEYAYLQMYAYKNDIDILGNANLYGKYIDKDGASMTLSNQATIYMETDLDLTVGDVLEGEGEFDGIRLLIKEIYSKEENITESVFMDYTRTNPVYSNKYHLKIEFIVGEIDSEDLRIDLYSDVIQIYTEEQLASIGVDYDDYPLYGQYVLMNDIDLDYTTEFTPIGSSTNPFTGTFDGDGHKLIGLTIDETGNDYVGLFSSVGVSGTIKNLGLENVDITGRDYVGALVGSNFGRIENCYVSSGSIANRSRSGGLIGSTTNNRISNCYSSDLEITITTTGASQGLTGGLIGYMYGSVSLVRTCYSINNTITNDGIGDRIGGFIGHMIAGVVRQCYSSGNTIINGDGNIGGFAGSISAVSYDPDYIVKDCFSSDTITGDSSVGGFCGAVSNYKINRCYSTTDVTGNTFVGGFAGVNSSSIISNCYWDTETSGQATSDGGTGRTTEIMKNKSNYENWNFDVYWTIYENLDQYPKLRIDGFVPVSTTDELNQIRRDPNYSTDYILISTVSDLQKIGNDPDYPINASYLLENDIDLTGVDWDPIRIDGSFDGNGHTITVDSIDYDIDVVNKRYGFFSENRGVIKNLGLIYDLTPSSTDTTDSVNIGLFCVTNKGTISDCYSEGSINITSSVLGSVRFSAFVHSHDGIITNSYSDSTVQSNSSTFFLIFGSFVNYSMENSSISNCYSIGSADNVVSSICGGFIGKSSGFIDASYSKFNFTTLYAAASYVKYFGGFAGSVSSGKITNCFSTGSVNFGIAQPITDLFFVGGFFGYAQSLLQENIIQFKYCYSTGEVNSGDAGTNIHGFAGYSYGFVSAGSCLYDNVTSGQTSDPIALGYATSALTKMSTLSNLQYDISLVSSDDDTVWKLNAVDQSTSGSYAYLSWMTNNDDYDGSEYPCWYNLTEDEIQGDSYPNNPVLLYEDGIPEYYYMLPLDDKYKLINDITFSDEYFSSIGSEQNQFSGIFDGNYYTISDFDISKIFFSSTCGFFNYISEDGVVKNLILKNVSTNQSADNSGVLCGTNYGTISKCATKFQEKYTEVHRHENIGGLVGLNQSTGTIKNCYSVCDLRWYEPTAPEEILGFDLSSASAMGGLVGKNYGFITNSYSTGVVGGAGFGQNTGGLVGYNYGRITRSFSDCTVTGLTRVGGLVGYSVLNDVEIKNCYSNASVTAITDDNDFVSAGENSVGGLIGSVFFYNDIENCYSISLVVNNNPSVVTAGGLIGKSRLQSTVTNCFWNIETSEQATSDGGTGLADLDAMNDEETFIGWNFNSIWEISDNVNYPQLQWSIGKRTTIWINESLLDGEYWDYGELVENPIFLWETDKREKTPLDLNLFTSIPGDISIYNILYLPYNTATPLNWRHNNEVDGVQNLCSNHEALDGLYCDGGYSLHITNGNYLSHADDLYTTMGTNPNSIRFTRDVDVLKLDYDEGSYDISNLLSIGSDTIYTDGYNGMGLGTGKELLMMVGLHALDFPGSSLYQRWITVYDENGDDVGSELQKNPTDLLTIFCSGTAEAETGKIRVNKGLFYHIYNRLLSTDYDGLFNHLNSPWVYDFYNHPNNTFRCCYIPFRQII